MQSCILERTVINPMFWEAAQVGHKGRGPPPKVTSAVNSIQKQTATGHGGYTQVSYLLAIDRPDFHEIVQFMMPSVEQDFFSLKHSKRGKILNMKALNILQALFEVSFG